MTPMGPLKLTCQRLGFQPHGVGILKKGKHEVVDHGRPPGKGVVLVSEDRSFSYKWKLLTHTWPLVHVTIFLSVSLLYFDVSKGP